MQVTSASQIREEFTEGPSKVLKRAIDLFLAFALMLFFSIPILFIALAVKLTSKGQVLYWSDRIGKDNKIFKMPKFRSMRTDTPAIATHLLTDADDYLTPIGSFLRRSSLDELPQIYSIVKGDLSFVGPRPALFNQYDLTSMRSQMGVHRLSPGLTGWAQVNGRDELPISEKVEFDFEYLNRRSFLFDLKILLMTLQKVLRQEGVAH